MSSFRYVNTVLLEAGAVSQLKKCCVEAGIERPLIVTDKGVRAAGVVDKVMAALDNISDIAIYDDTTSNPTEEEVRDALISYQKNKCDGIIAIGGGSSIDCAKGVCILAAHTEALKTFATIEGGSSKITKNVPPLIAIPTTAGTGSEVARGAVIIVDDGRKLGFHSWHLVPKFAILDPTLTVGLPPYLTAATGMDAITHCIEAYMAPTYNPPADGIALDGLKRGWKHIDIATNDGADINARLQMLSVSMQGALAFQKGLGCVHSLSHSLGGINPSLHHGTLNAIFLPSIVRFNAEAETIKAENRLEQLAEAIGLGDIGSQNQAAAALVDAILKMNKNLGLPDGLAAVGVDESEFDQIIDRAMLDHCHLQGPRIATRDDYRRLLNESM